MLYFLYLPAFTTSSVMLIWRNSLWWSSTSTYIIALINVSKCLLYDIELVRDAAHFEFFEFIFLLWHKCNFFSENQFLKAVHWLSSGSIITYAYRGMVSPKFWAPPPPTSGLYPPLWQIPPCSSIHKPPPPPPPHPKRCQPCIDLHLQ